MGPAGRPLPPTSSLPSLRQRDTLSEAQLRSALDNLSAIYCPAAAVLAQSALRGAASEPFKLTTRLAPLTDSGYNSGYNSDNEDDDDDDDDSGVADIDRLRADEHERAFATRWVTRLVAAGEELLCFASDEARQEALETAGDLLNALLCPPPHPDDAEGCRAGGGGDDDDLLFAREFTFALPRGSEAADRDCSPVSVRLNDGLAGRTGEDHLDVGLQTWGASIVLCQMMCHDAAAFGLGRAALGGHPRVVELGAGTGLVSLVLGQLLPRLGVECPVVVATDYHPAVIANLRENIALNRGTGGEGVKACALDWGEAELDPEWPLGEDKADVLVATDVVYAAEHATMLYHCASRLLAPEGVFWLLATVRQNGRFNGVDETVEAVFGAEGRARSAGAGRTLGILASENLEKRSGVGRGDETFYKLFRIGWTST